MAFKRKQLRSLSLSRPFILTHSLTYNCVPINIILRYGQGTVIATCNLLNHYRDDSQETASTILVVVQTLPLVRRLAALVPFRGGHEGGAATGGQLRNPAEIGNKATSSVHDGSLCVHQQQQQQYKWCSRNPTYYIILHVAHERGPAWPNRKPIHN